MERHNVVRIKDVEGLPLVVIVGRPNVGKSTLFNRLVGRRVSIEETVSGVTRDVVTTLLDVEGTPCELADTGGMLDKVSWDEEVLRGSQRLLRQAVSEADLVVMVVDAAEGLLATDSFVAKVVRKSRKPCILVANKADNPKREESIGEFYALGLGEPLAVSALHGLGVGELLEEIKTVVKSLSPSVKVSDELCRVALVGKRNVGKSTLMNRFFRAERVLVDDRPGTTRDAVEVLVEYGNRRFIAIDTAGVRRRRSVEDSIEAFSIMRTIYAIKRASVVLFMLDATVPLSRVDKKLASIVVEATKPVVLVINKWDIAEKEGIEPRSYVRYINRMLVGLSFAPMVFISALYGNRVEELLDVAFSLHRQSQYRVSTGRLNRIIGDAVRRKQARSGTRLGKIYYAVQTGVEPPNIVLFVNEPRLFSKQYIRFIENFLRDRLPFCEVPLKITLRRSKGK